MSAPHFNTTHGMEGTRFYNIWIRLTQRTGNPNYHEFHFYGGRGIKNLWERFEDFRDDMYGQYLAHCEAYGVKDTTLDRIDNDEGYSKSNCRWATAKEQARNRRSNIWLELNGERKVLKDWAADYSIEYRKVWTRVRKLGWTLEKALTTSTL